MENVLTKNRNVVPTVSSNVSVNIFLFFVLYGIFSQYFLLSIVAGLSLSLIFQQFRKAYVPAALLFYFGMEWLHIFATILFADYTGQSITQLNDTPHFEPVLIMGFVQLTIMAIVAGKIFTKDISSSKFALLKASMSLNPMRVLMGFLICTAVFPTLLAFTRSNASVNQLVQSFSVLRSVFLMMLVFILFTRPTRLKGVIILLLIVEILLGFTSFFSSFKETFFFIIVVYLTVTPKLKPSLILKLSPLIIVLFVILSYWQAVKADYRMFLSGGSGMQEVTVSKSEAYAFLWNRVKQVKKEDFNTGIEDMISRAAALKYYLIVHERVPKLLPHTDGEMLKDNIMFVTVPRSLNSNKGILDPSVNTSYYTGQSMKTAAEGTSIALGYFCDLYIDFGLFGMIFPIAILGAIIGWFAHYIINLKNVNRLFVYALLIGVVLNFGSVESDSLFVLGVLRNFIVFVLLGNKFVFPWIMRKITHQTIEE